MPKTQIIHPSDLRRAGQLETARIPLNQYNRSFEDELKAFSADEQMKIVNNTAILWQNPGY